MEIHSYEADWVWYVPDFKTNRELPEDEQFRVQLVPLSKRDYQKLEAGHLALKKLSKKQIAERYNKMKEHVVAKSVMNVENLSHVVIKKSGERVVEDIKTGEELAKHVPEEVIEDIISALKDQSLIEEGLQGKSDSPSDTSP